MINSKNQKPVVLIIAGHDPCGGAGIQADIETITNAGCAAASVITSLTAQNTSQVKDIIAQESKAFHKQIRMVLEDMTIAACKIGMIGNEQLIDIIENELSKLNIPIVLDPVIKSSSGQSFANENICKKLLSLILPITTVVTPNANEARMLTHEKDLNLAAEKLLSFNVKSALITGADEDTEAVTNVLYTHNNSPIEYHWERLTGSFHGSGCTLSSRIATLLALGDDLQSSIEKAQAYTWNTLKHALEIGQNQLLPNRFYEE